MCQRAREPALGEWTVPCGFLECGETLEEGAVREVLEETSVRLDPQDLSLYSVVNMTAMSQVLIAFRVELREMPELMAGPECLDVAFMAEEALDAAPLAWRGSQSDGPARVFRELRSGDFSIQLIRLGSESGEGFEWKECRPARDNKKPPR
jgi:ADP-ribose pyrophosphatase YjhB (NUDIX family)